MSIPYRRPASTYALAYHSPGARIGRALRRAGRFCVGSAPVVLRAAGAALAAAWRARFALLVCLLALMPGVESDVQRLADRLAKVTAERDAIAQYAGGNVVRFSVEGPRGFVAQAAQQFSNLPQ